MSPVSSSFIRTLILPYQGSTFRISFNLNHLLKGNTINMGFKLQHMNLSGAGGRGERGTTEPIALSYTLPLFQ